MAMYESGRTSFIIDTPYHKRWWLPDDIHQFNTVINGNHIRWSIIHGRHNETVKSGIIELKEGWEDLMSLAQELAEKAYRRFDARRA